MDPSVLKAALSRLLAHGEAAGDAKLTRMAEEKKKVGSSEPQVCAECKVPMVDGKCPDCGKEAEPPQDGGQDESGLADLLESDSKG